MEAELVRWLRERLPIYDSIVLGAGDDAAICRYQASEDIVVTTDLLCDGVHFHVGTTSLELIGRKCLAVNLSDLAAMAARPTAAVVSLLLPRSMSLPEVQQLYLGLIDLARQFRVSIIGGDTNRWDQQLAVSVTAFGQVTSRGPLRRDGARPGDWILVTGSLGGSLEGHHLEFTPRVAEALHLQSHFQLHAGMDISDGLALDLSRLLSESGVGAILDLTSIPISKAAHARAKTTGRNPIEHALGDGEDFELLLTAPPEQAQEMLADRTTNCPLSKIGVIVPEFGLWTQKSNGELLRLEPTGYLH